MKSPTSANPTIPLIDVSHTFAAAHDGSTTVVSPAAGPARASHAILMALCATPTKVRDLTRTDVT